MERLGWGKHGFREVASAKLKITANNRRPRLGRKSHTHTALSCAEAYKHARRAPRANQRPSRDDISGQREVVVPKRASLRPPTNHTTLFRRTRMPGARGSAMCGGLVTAGGNHSRKLGAPLTQFLRGAQWDV